MSNQIIEDLNWRYTTKHYDESKTISKEDMETIKEALRMSASSINSQPWKFIIIESDEAKKRFHKTFEENFQFNQKHATHASHSILFAHKTHFAKEDYKRRVDVEVESGHLAKEMYDQMMGAIAFAEMVADENGNNAAWTKAQSYIALGNILHVLARLKIDSTPMEGVDGAAIKKEFAKELGEGYECTFALSLGYRKEGEDYNAGKPKARLAQEEIIEIL